MPLEHRYGSSAGAVAALHDGDCDFAGLHIPPGLAQGAALAHCQRWLAADDLAVVDIASRRQGWVVAAGNPRKVYELARPDQRFINRQLGSGTRLLLKILLELMGIAPSASAGFGQGELAHAAVVAYVASGMADVGFGLETPARRFKLDFIPLATERYFLLCRRATLASAAMGPLLQLLRSGESRVAVDARPGYSPCHRPADAAARKLRGRHRRALTEPGLRRGCGRGRGRVWAGPSAQCLCPAMSAVAALFSALTGAFTVRVSCLPSLPSTTKIRSML